MKLFVKISAFIGATALVAAFANTPAPDLAPDFTLKNAEGKDVRLSDFKGKFVVLEWWNYQCPFVVKHYDSNNMQNTQKELSKEGVVWLTICSSADGQQGYVTGDEAKKIMKSKEGSPSHILLDAMGTVGKAYKAKTTPHMFLISPKGEILYNGAIDSIRSANKADIEKAENYIKKAFREASSGKAVTTATTQPYGCSVKYAN